MKKTTLQQFSEQEFIELAEKIILGDFPSTDELINAAMHFISISEHPAGFDLICYPKNFNITGGKSMVNVIKGWRMLNGLPTFRQENIPATSDV